MKAVWIALPLSLGIGGCKASLNAEAKAGTNGKASANADADLSQEEPATVPKGTDLEKPIEQSSAQVEGSSEAPPPDDGPVLLGARHDLHYKGATTATCKCLAVALGEPSSPDFTWQGVPPKVSAQTQLVIALSSHGVNCDAETDLGVSYRGYTQQGDDIVVQVEKAHAGRPITSGAVIPKPVGTGQVYIKPANKDVPFGAPLDGKGLCQIGNPGPVRTLDTVEIDSEPIADAEPDLEVADGEARATGDVVDSIEVIDDYGKERMLDDPYTRDGIFLALHPGISYMMLRSDPDIQNSGFGFGLDFLIGGSLAQDLVVGVALGGATFPTVTAEVSGEETGESEQNLFHVGGFLDYYLSEEGGFHFLAELGYTNLGSTSNRTSSTERTGFNLGLALGNDWWISESLSLGLMGRFNLGLLSSKASSGSHTLLLPHLLFTATYH